MEIKVIIFDFDGVILESTKIKNQAFGKLYSKFGKSIESKVLKYDLLNQGISRFNKIKFFHSNYLGIKLNDIQMNKIAKQYQDLVIKQILRCEFVPGAKEFIEKEHSNYSFFIATGTPEKEIEYITESLGINKFFVSIHGSPLNKNKIIQKIIENNKLNPSSVLMVGDSYADYEASMSNQINFIRRKHSTQESVFAQNTYAINDLKELNKMLDKIN